GGAGWLAAWRSSSRLVPGALPGRRLTPPSLERCPIGAWWRAWAVVSCSGYEISPPLAVILRTGAALEACFDLGGRDQRPFGAVRSRGRLPRPRRRRGPLGGPPGRPRLRSRGHRPRGLPGGPAALPHLQARRQR